MLLKANMPLSISD